jgi:hypothetical protein
VGVRRTAFFTGRIDEVQTFTLTGGVIGEGKAPDHRGPDGRLRGEHGKFRFECR